MERKNSDACGSCKVKNLFTFLHSKEIDSSFNRFDDTLSLTHLRAISIQKELNQVLFEEGLGVRKVILYRPKKLNSLKHDMICQMLKKLEVYENDPTINLLILKANGRAFCAGGDVTALISSITAGHWTFGTNFYRKQLTLDYLLGTYNKPVVAIINGIVMGGAEEVFAMPEVSIGLFPDVGASHFLSRLPGFVGEYIGLSCARLDGSAMLACRLATHFILSKDLALLEKALDMVASSNVFDIIKKCFSRETVEEILSSLEGLLANREDKWIIDAINSMKIASPTSLKVFLRSIRDGRAQTLDQCLIREFNIFYHIMKRKIGDDFLEGSRAMIIDKDKNPQEEDYTFSHHLKDIATDPEIEVKLIEVDELSDYHEGRIINLESTPENII